MKRQSVSWVIAAALCAFCSGCGDSETAPRDEPSAAPPVTGALPDTVSGNAQIAGVFRDLPGRPTPERVAAAADALAALGEKAADVIALELFHRKPVYARAAVGALVALGRPGTEALLQSLDVAAVPSPPDAPPARRTLESEGARRHVRGFIIKALGQSRDTTALPRLFELATGKDTQSAAFRAIKLFGSDANDGLLKLTESFDPKAALGATRLLATNKHPRAPELLVRLLSNKDFFTRKGAARELAKLGPEVDAPLLALLKTGTEPGAPEAGKLLGQRKVKAAIPLLIAAADDGRFQTYVSAGRGLEALGNDAMPALRAALRPALKTRSGRLAGRLLQVIIKIGPKDLTDLLIEAIQGKDFFAAGLASRTLGERKDPRAIEPLLTMRDQGSNSRSWTALKAYGDKAVPELLRVGTDADRDHYVRNKALSLLGTSKSPAAFEPLLAIAHEDKGPLGLRAIWSLGELGDARARKPLLELFRKETSMSRWQSEVTALGKLGEPAIGKALIAAVGKRQPARLTPRGFGYQPTILKALGRLKPPGAARAIGAAVKNGSLRPFTDLNVALETLGTIGDPVAVPYIAHLATHKSEHVRTRLANALLKIKGPAALAPLKTLARNKSYLAVAAANGLLAFNTPEADKAARAVASGHPSSQARAAVLTTLAKRDGIKALAFIIKRCRAEKDPACRYECVKLLAGLKSKDALDALVEAANKNVSSAFMGIAYVGDATHIPVLEAAMVRTKAAIDKRNTCTSFPFYQARDALAELKSRLAKEKKP